MFISVIGRVRIMGLLLFQPIADFVFVGEGEVQTVRPAGMPGDDLRRQSPLPQPFFQSGQRALGKLVILRQTVDKAVAAVCAEPEGIAGEEVGVVNQIHHMPKIPKDIWIDCLNSYCHLLSVFSQSQ